MKEKISNFFTSLNSWLKELSLRSARIIVVVLFKDILAIDFGDVRISSTPRSFQILVVRGGEIEKVRRSVTLVVILLWIGQL